VTGRERPTALVVGLDGADLRSFADEVRAAGLPVALVGGFDGPGFFAAACESVDTPAARCLYVGDDDRAIRAARAAGLSAFRYTGTADLGYLRAALLS
jgi:phosphoglycolate phosphatase-like HAD superfamily hydrolase